MTYTPHPCTTRPHHTTPSFHTQRHAPPYTPLHFLTFGSCTSALPCGFYRMLVGCRVVPKTHRSIGTSRFVTSPPYLLHGYACGVRFLDRKVFLPQRSYGAKDVALCKDRTILLKIGITPPRSWTWPSLTTVSAMLPPPPTYSEAHGVVQSRNCMQLAITRVRLFCASRAHVFLGLVVSTELHYVPMQFTSMHLALHQKVILSLLGCVILVQGPC